MKKAVLIFPIIVLINSVSFAENPAKSGLIFEGQLSANVTPKNTFKTIQHKSSSYGVINSDIDNGGLGVGLYLGYDYALNGQMTIGIKSGYQYINSLNEFKQEFRTLTSPELHNL